MDWLSQILGLFRPLQCWIVIAPWEAGLRVRLGKHAKTLVPGFHLRIPFLDRIFVVATRLRTVHDSGQTISTLDGKTLTLGMAISYSVADIGKLFQTVTHPERTMLHLAQGHIAEFVSTNNSPQLTPAAIERHMAARMICTDWGLADVKIMIVTFAFVRTYRLLNYEFRNTSGLDEVEGAKS